MAGKKKPKKKTVLKRNAIYPTRRGGREVLVGNKWYSNPNYERRTPVAVSDTTVWEPIKDYLERTKKNAERKKKRGPIPRIKLRKRR